MTSDSIPFILYATGAMLMALLLVIAWNDRDTDRPLRPTLGKRSPASSPKRRRPCRRRAAQASRLRQGTLARQASVPNFSSIRRLAAASSAGDTAPGLKPLRRRNVSTMRSMMVSRGRPV